MRLTVKYTLMDTEPAEASRRPRPRPPSRPPTVLPTAPTVLPTASVRLSSRASRNGASSNACAAAKGTIRECVRIDIHNPAACGENGLRLRQADASV